MKLSRVLAGSALALVATFGVAQAGHASEVLYDGIGLFQGSSSFTDTFSVNGPGTLTVTVSDMAFPVPLSNLNFLVSTPLSLLGPETGAGTMTYKIASAEQISVQTFGTAAGALNMGVYGMNIQFSPATPVPLPTSIALLLSGLGVLLWQRRQAA